MPRSRSPTPAGSGADARAEQERLPRVADEPRGSEQLDLFRALPGDLAPRDAQDLMAYPFFSLAKSKRLAPIDFRAGPIAIRVEAVPEHGMATIWDADVLIWAASQIVHARDAGLQDLPPDGGDALRDPDLRRPRRQRPRLSAPQGRRSTGSSRPPSRPRSGSRPNVAVIASPGSTNGRRRPTPTAARSASN